MNSPKVKYPFVPTYCIYTELKLLTLHELLINLHRLLIGLGAQKGSSHGWVQRYHQVEKAHAVCLLPQDQCRATWYLLLLLKTSAIYNQWFRSHQFLFQHTLLFNIYCAFHAPITDITIVILIYRSPYSTQ